MSDPVVETPIEEPVPSVPAPPNKPLSDYTVDDWWTLGWALHMDPGTYTPLAIPAMGEMKVQALVEVRAAVEAQKEVIKAETSRRMAALFALEAAINTALK